MAQALNATTDEREYKRRVRGWAMYDWANSAFSTTVGTVFLGPYLASLVAEACPPRPEALKAAVNGE